MSLPKLSFPTFELTLPSTKQVVKYRPFLVKEEKILLIAQSSEDPSQILNAVKQVLNNCIISEDIDVNSLTTFDIEYMFIKIRAKSVNNIINLTYKDNEDDQKYTFEVDLDEIEVKEFPGHTNKVALENNDYVLLKYPGPDIAKAVLDSAEEADVFFKIIVNCIDKIFIGGVEYDASKYSEEELDEFLQSLNVSTFKNFQEFFDTMPRLYHELKYTNSNGNERVIKLTNLNDFFTLG